MLRGDMADAAAAMDVLGKAAMGKATSMGKIVICCRWG